MIDTDELEQQNESQPPVRVIVNKRNDIKIVLNVFIVLCLIIAGYFTYAYVLKNTKSEVVENTQVSSLPVLQLDVLNGCGAKGIGAKFTNHLRAKGFDVVESKNYKSFQIPHTLVVDRIGDLAAARQVAAALGVSEKNIVQQINPDYFVDVSVIIGKDYFQIISSR
ncbi:MAG: LytR C-terminal domain-containing protein [Bacteroidota bacterium]|nr:LytR C-terminal domain-containing protein [Bacteroidota bacterium]